MSAPGPIGDGAANDRATAALRSVLELAAAVDRLLHDRMVLLDALDHALRAAAADDASDPDAFREHLTRARAIQTRFAPPLAPALVTAPQPTAGAA